MDSPNACEHSDLRCSCLICEQAAELIAIRAQLAAAEAALAQEQERNRLNVANADMQVRDIQAAKAAAGLYPLSGGKENVVHPYGQPVKMGRRWMVESPVLRKSKLFEEGIQDRMTIVEQADGTFGVLESDGVTWHGREHRSLDAAHKAASDALRANDAKLPAEKEE